MDLPKRKPNRMKGYDYSSNGAYFVTVCTKNKEKIFGDISAPTGTNKQRLEIIIGQMKRWVSKQAGAPLWQKSFHVHIVRTEEDYFYAWSYIDSNPRLWLEEKDNH